MVSAMKVFLNGEELTVPHGCVLWDVVAAAAHEDIPENTEGLLWIVNRRIIPPPYNITLREDDEIKTLPILSGG